MLNFDEVDKGQEQTMPKVDGYYYLHTNGDLIYKPATVMDSDPSYFDSSFVKKVWPITLDERETAYTLLLDAEAMGARIERIHELKTKWNITEKDTQTFADRMGFLLSMDGKQWFARLPDFVNVQESPAGFGDTRWDALVELCKEVKNGSN